MKKFLSILMAAALVMSLTVSAFAVDASGNSTSTLPDETSIGVEYTLKTADGEGTTLEGDPVYYVVISWETTSDLVVTSTASGAVTTYTWDAENMVYKAETTTEAGASSDNEASGSSVVAVTVVNQSNASVDIGVEWEETTADTTSCSWDEEGGTLTTAAVDSDGDEISYTDTTTTGSAQEGTYTAAVTITDASSVDTSSTTIGTITVTVSASSEE